MENRSSYSDVTEKARIVMETAARVAAAAGRKPEEIRILAAVKTVAPDRINAAVEAGIRLLGENRAQEVTEKFGQYDPRAELHFIGHLQRNKVRQIVDKVSMIQSVDSLALAEEISRQAMARCGRPMKILMEVNIGGEESKSGVSPEKAWELAQQMDRLPGILLQGMMCIPPVCANSLESERYFDQMHQLFVDIQAKKLDNGSIGLLSMGMSGDYPLAIKHGSNLIRVGSAIFGKRN